MSWFADDDETSDAALIKAARKRLLGELAGKQAAAAQSVINNYGGGGGVMDHLATRPAPAGDDEPLSYYVDITRRDLDEVNPKTGKPVGWSKSVHRHTGPRDDDGKKKAR